MNTSTVSTSGHPNAGSYTQSVGSTLGGTDAGDYTFAGSTTPTANYAINPLALTAAIAASSSSYGSALNPGAVTLSGSLTGDLVSVGGATVNTSTVSTSGHPNAGSYTQSVGSTLGGTDAGDYTFAGSTTPTANYAINPLALTAAIAASSSSYGSALQPGAATFTNVISGDNLGTVSVAVNTTGNTSASGHLNAGSYMGIQYVGGLSGPDAGNYTYAGISGNYTVTPAPLTITAQGFNKIYDGTVVGASFDPYTNKLLSWAAPSITGNVYDSVSAYEVYATKNAGTGITLTPMYTITDGNGGQNYAVTVQTATGNIAPRPILLTGNRLYDTTTPAASNVLAIGNLISGDNVTLSGMGTLTTAGGATTQTVANFANLGTLALSGADAGNYVLTQAIVAANANPNGSSVIITPATAANLTGADLAGANLNGDNLTNVILTDADLAGANLNKTNLTGANLTNADLIGANLNNALIVISTTVTGADFKGANLNGTSDAKTTMSTTLSSAATTAPPTTFTGPNDTGQNLSGAYLANMNLAGANLSGVNLSGANLTGVNLTGANLAGANLMGAILYGATLSGADLIGANLQGRSCSRSMCSSRIANKAAAPRLGRSNTANQLKRRLREDQGSRPGAPRMCRTQIGCAGIVTW